MHRLQIYVSIIYQTFFCLGLPLVTFLHSRCYIVMCSTDVFFCWVSDIYFKKTVPNHVSSVTSSETIYRVTRGSDFA